MIERAFVHVGGPPGSGKTTFIEAILAGADAVTLVARCLRDDTLARAREGAPRTHPELRRYRQTGAAGAAVYTFPGQQSSTDDFFMTNLMMNYSQAVVLEGESPLGYVDLRVFVAPAPARTEKLFVRRARRGSPDEAAGRVFLAPPSFGAGLPRRGPRPGRRCAAGRVGPQEPGARRKDAGHPRSSQCRAGERAPRSTGASPTHTPASSTPASWSSTPATVATAEPPKLSSPTWSGCARTRSSPRMSWAPEATGYP